MFGVRRLTGVVGILVLLAVTIVLVAAAIIRHHKHSSGVVLYHDISGATTPVFVPYQPSTSARAALRRPAPLIATSNASAVFVARGGCRQLAKLEGSLNGGQTWLKLVPPAPHLLQLQLSGNHSGYVVGADSTCLPSKYVPVNATSWSPATSAGGTWFSTPNGVHTPSDRIVTPCGSAHPAPISLATSGGQSAIVVCRVGVYVTTSGGSQWSAAGQIPKGHPVSVGLTTKGRGVMLLAHGSACRGLRVAVTADTGLTWRQGVCLGDLAAPAAVALAPDGYGAATDGGKTTYTTADAGISWR